MSTEDEILCLSQSLGLSNEPQDWGIINASAERIYEFLSYVRNHNLTPAQQYVMSELIMASFNESLLEGSFDSGLQGLFTEFLKSDLYGVSSQIEYWENLKNTQEFPIANYLRSIVDLA